MKFITKAVLFFSLLLVFCSLSVAEPLRKIELVDEKDRLVPGSKFEYFAGEDDFTIGSVLDNVAVIDWQKADRDILNFGFSGASYWFRAEIVNNSPITNWYLHIDNALLSAVEFYVVNHNQVSQAYITGDRFNFSVRPLEHRSYIFPFAIEPGQTSDIYMKIQSNRSVQAPIYIAERTEFFIEDVKKNLYLGIYLGFLLLMLLTNGLVFLVSKDLVHLYYLFFIATVGLLELSYFGLGFQFLWSGSLWWQQHSLVVSSSLVFVSILLFLGEFLRLKKANAWSHKIFMALLIYSFVCLVLSLVVNADIAAPIIAYTTIVGSLLVLAVLVINFRKDNFDTQLSLVAWLLFLMGAIAFSLNKLGIWPRNFITEHGIQMGLVVQLLLFSLALTGRIRQYQKKTLNLLRSTKDYQRRLEAANLRALEYERMGKLSLEKRIESRTEQLEVALAELDKANLRLTDSRNLDRLTGAMTQQDFRERLISEWVRAAREKTWLSLLMISVDQFQFTVERYGVDAANEVLKTMSRILINEAARPADLVARIGDAEFAVLMPNTPESGGRYIAKLIHKKIVAEPLNLGICTLSVAVSIGVACQQPGEDSDVDKFFDSAQDALLSTLKLGGNGVAVGSC